MSAPKGNANALRHGLYAKHYTPEQRKELSQMAHDDLRHEINSARVVAADILKCHYQIMAGEKVDLDQLAKNVGSFCNIIERIGLAVSRYSLLTGSNPGLNDSLAEALATLPMYEDEENVDLRKGID
jgi:hypothetical protein